MLIMLSALVLGIVAFRLARHRPPGAVAPLILSHSDRVGSIVLMLAAIATWTGGYAISLIVSGPEATVWFHRIAFLGVAGTPPAVLAVALDLTGRNWRSTPWIAALFTIPVVTMAAALTSDYHGWLWTSVAVRQVGALTPLGTTPGQWFWLHTVFSYAALAVAFVALIREYGRAPHDYMREGLVIGLAFLAPWAVNIAYVTSNFGVAVDPTPVGLLITATLFYWVLRRSHFADLLPVAWDTVIETLEDPVVVVDGKARVVDANLAARRLLQDEDMEAGGFLAELARLLEGGRQSGALTVGKDPQHCRMYDVRISPVPLPRSTVRLRAVAMRDVTEQLRYEEGKKELERQLHHAQRLESVGVLAGGIAHDFNNLLTAILGSAELASAELPDGHPAKQSIELAIDGSVRAAELTRELLAYAGKGRADMQILDVSECVRTIESLAVAAISKGVRLRTDLPATLPSIRGDSTQIQQVIMNLILNGAESHEDGRGVVTLTIGTVESCDDEKAIVVGADDASPGRHVYIDASDRGCGMDAARQARMFDPFFTTKSSGRGLGLSSLLGIVRGHRGQIAVSSEPGQGTTIRVLLPVASGEMSAIKGTSEAVARPRTGGVLVVDDDDAVRSAATRALSSFGYQVFTAEDGRAALDVFRIRRDAIDVVLLDVTMPDMSGIEVLHALKAQRPDLPIVLSSGYTEADVGGVLSSDTTSFLAKPYTRKVLAEAIERALGHDADLD